MRIWSLVLVVALAGCSAGRAAVALVQADRAIDNARRRGAPEEAPYELAMAEAYLTKAREEAHFSSYRASVELARGAADWADRAIIQMEQEGTAGSASAPDAPGGVPSSAASSAAGDDAAPAPPPPSPKRDPWKQPDAAPPADPPPEPPPGTPPDRQASPPKVIVVPKPTTSEPDRPPPKLIVVPRPPPDDASKPDDDADEAPEEADR